MAPTWRKKLLDAVAVPTMRLGNEFCTMSTRICMLRPMPAPNTAMNKHNFHMGSDAVIVDINHNPSPVITMPIKGKNLYLPVLDTTCPDTMEVTRRLPIMGVISSPAVVASTPLAI